MAQAKQDMGAGSIKKLMLQLMIPAVVAQVVNLLYNIVDRIYIGHIAGIGAAALTGVGLFTPILMLLNAFAMLVGAGGAPRTAIALGQGDRQQAEKIVSNSFTMLMFFAVVLTIGFYAGAPVLLRLNRELGVTVLMSTHTPGAALAQADGVLLLRAGRCTCYDDPHAFARALRQSGDPMLQALPVGAILFDEVPLTVREAQPLAAHLRCKPAPAPQPAGKSVLTLKEICFAYEKKSADVLFRLSLTLTAGKCYGIVGANGSGKSTLLGVMAGVLKPYAGKVQRPVPTALLPQTVQYLFTRDRVDQLVQAETLQHLGIAHLAARHPLDLSGGESRLVGLGMVLDTGADTLLLDEPTAGLDAGAKAQLGARLRHLCAAGKTVVLVTHDLDFAGTYSDEAAFLCNRVVTPPRPRRAFFAGMELYTTGVRRVTCRALPDAVSPEDLVL